jgi:5'-3' exonuclease
MQIFIRGLTGKIILVDVESCNTIEDIKLEIEKKEDIGIDQQRLVFKGRQLEDNYTISDYGIQKESELLLSLSLLGGGVPQYFRQIIKNHPTTHFWKDEMPVDHLLIDFNSMIYQVINILNEELGPSVGEISPVNYENKLIVGIIKQLQHVICEVIRPKKTVYIAVDGPPPRAKMVQQRARRYKTLKEQAFRKDLEKKYKVNIPTLQWNKSAISPGTSFMIKLSKIIIKNIQQKNLQLHNENIIVIFSDDSVPGEGEHKLLPSIRRMKNSNNETSVIYSPDADLIILSIMSGINNIFILREPKDSDIEINLYKEHEFLYLNIDTCREEFCKEISISMHINEEYYKEMLKDYSFLTFLCGNDFVVAAPFLKVKEGGIQILIDAHKIIFTQLNKNEDGTLKENLQFLIGDKQEINELFLMLLLKELVVIEEEKLKRWQRKRDKIRQGIKNKKEVDESKKTLWELELIKFNHEEYYSPEHPHYEHLNKVFDKIDYFKPEWNDMYNKHFFPEENNIDIICYEYLKSLHFCLKYYFEIPPSWTWFYKYRAAPSIRQLASYLEQNLGKIIIEWGNTTSYTPFEQLMLILPRQSFKLLPKVLAVEDDLEQFYPKSFILDIVHGQKFIYSEPILPEIPIEKIRAKIKSVEDQFTILEKERNTLRSKPYVHKPN